MANSFTNSLNHALTLAMRHRRFALCLQFLFVIVVSLLLLFTMRDLYHERKTLEFGGWLLALFLIVALHQMKGRVKLAEQLVRTRTAELDLAMQAIGDQLTESKSLHVLNRQRLMEIANGASHDLLTPLRSISGFTKLLQDEYRDNLSDKGIDYIQQIISSTDRMRKLVLDLLNYSRVESQSLVLRPVRLNELFDKVSISLWREIEDAEGIVTRDDLPVVNGDVEQLSQLFLNLLANSLKYRGSAPARIHVSATLTDTWSVAIRDNGIGIDQTFHHQVFDIFRRLHAHAEYPGTGVGLALCRRIVQRHGGRIWVESELGKGCTFFFTIPKLVDCRH